MKFPENPNAICLTLAALVVILLAFGIVGKMDYDDAKKSEAGAHGCGCIVIQKDDSTEYYCGDNAERGVES
jgi:hypothetical protein